MPSHQIPKGLRQGREEIDTRILARLPPIGTTDGGHLSVLDQADDLGIFYRLGVLGTEEDLLG